VRGVVQQGKWSQAGELEAFLEFFKAAKLDPRVDKSQYVREIQKLVPPSSTMKLPEPGPEDVSAKREARSAKR